MGRRRKQDKHLPRRVYLVHGSYWFRPKDGQPVNLGRDLADALARYARLIDGRWAGRTLGDVIDRYRTEVLPLKRSATTRADQAKQLDRLKQAFGIMLPDIVTARHCYAYQDGDLGPGSPRRAQVTLPQVEAVKSLASERMRIAIDLAVCTGQRRGDLLALKREQLTDDGIIFRQSKTGAGVLIEWSHDLQAIVARAKALSPQIPADYLIRKRDGRPYTEDGFSAIWQRLMAKHVKAGGIRFSFHDLRSVSADGAATPEEARARLGHASVVTTRRHYLRGLTKAKPRS